MTGHTNLAQISRDDASSNKAHLEMELLLELEMELKSKNPQSHKSNAHIFSGGVSYFGSPSTTASTYPPTLHQNAVS